MEKTYKTQEVMKWFNQFENKRIVIKGKSIEFDIKVDKYSSPHLLGLQYINEERNKKRGQKLYEYIFDNNYSDQEILKRVKENNPLKSRSVKERIKTFKYFMENLEKGIIVENTHKNTDIKVENFIIQFKKENEKDLILHIGVSKGEYIDMFTSKDLEIDLNFDKHLDTYMSRKNNSYYKNTELYEEIEGIYLVEEEKTRPFSFDEEKDRKYREEEKARGDSWGTYLNREKNNDKEQER